MLDLAFWKSAVWSIAGRPGRAGLVFTLAVLILLSAIGRPRTGLAGSWPDTRVSGPFVCRAEFSLASWQGLLRELGQLQNDLVRHLEIPAATEPIEVYLFRDKYSYTRYLKRYLPEVPFRRALYVKSQQGPGRVFAYRSKELPTDLRHECTHALLHAVLPVVPLWLDEGLAEYFEVTASKRAFDNPHLGSLRWSLRLGMAPRLANLEKKGNMPDMGRGEYRASWAWVHFMLHGPEQGHDELVAYLQDIRANTPPGLLSERLDRQLHGSRDRFVAHFRAWKR